MVMSRSNVSVKKKIMSAGQEIHVSSFSKTDTWLTYGDYSTTEQRVHRSSRELQGCIEVIYIRGHGRMSSLV
jgi:hypothetical protein